MGSQIPNLISRETSGNEYSKSRVPLRQPNCLHACTLNRYSLLQQLIFSCVLSSRARRCSFSQKETKGTDLRGVKLLYRAFSFSVWVPAGGVVVCGVVVGWEVIVGVVGEGSEFESFPGMRTAIRTNTSKRQKTPTTIKTFEVLQHAKVELE